MPRAKLISDELLELRQLVRGADSIELKVTVPEQSQRSANQILGIDPLQTQIREVFFFDTPDLALNQAGVVARARRIQGRDHDSVIELRPVVPDELPADLRANPDFVVEVDALPGGYVCSGSFKAALRPDAIHGAVHGDRPLRKLFTKAQRAFYAAHAPAGIELDDLLVLGPIFVLKAKVTPPDLGQRLVAELGCTPTARASPCATTSPATASTSTATSRRRPRRRSSSSPTSGGRTPDAALPNHSFARSRTHSARRRPAYAQRAGAGKKLR